MKIRLWPAILAFSGIALFPQLAAAQTPTITSITPSSANAGDASLTITVKGTNFFAFTAVGWISETDAFAGLLENVTFVNSTQLSATIPAAYLVTAQAARIFASNPGGLTSNSVPFTIGGGGGTPPPAVTTLSPNTTPAGGPAFTMTVTGTGFVSGATVKWNGTALATTFGSATQLTASVTADLIKNAGSANIVVANPGSAASNSVSFTISGPVISTLSPGSAASGGAAFTLTVNGSGFVPASTVVWNGTNLTTTFGSATQLTAAVTAALIQNSGSASIVVSNSSGAVSGSVAFTISAPVISSLSPGSATAGGTAFTLTVNGSGFVSASTVAWNGTALTTTFLSGSQLSAQVPASLIQTSGSANIVVSNSASSSSGALAFTINSSGTGGTSATLTALSPNSAVAGGAAFNMTVTGSGFVSASTVQWNGTALTTSLVSSSQLTAAVPATLIQSGGSASVVVSNPGGAVSGALPFTISGPAISSLSPNSATAGSADFTLTVNGSGFVSASTISWNGTVLTTTFVSPSQLSALVSASLIQTSGSANIVVANSASSVSGALAFTINSSGTTGTPPTLTAIAPNSAVAGGAAFTMTLTGAGFVSGSVVQWSGSNLATSFVSASQLTASVPAALIQTDGFASIVVSNPDSTVSGALPFTITPIATAPVISTLAPNVAAAGGAAFTLTVNGFGFVSASSVSWNGSALTTTFISSGLLAAQVPASLIQTSGSANVAVTNPGIAASAAVAFTINQAGSGGSAPILTALTPNNTTAGGAFFLLTVSGVNFPPNAIVQWNGISLPTATLNSVQLIASVTSALIQSAGTASVAVLNPGGAVSGALTFTINPATTGVPSPAISDISPSSAAGGGPAFVLTINGSGFVAGATAGWNNTPLATTFVSAGQLLALVPGWLIQTLGTASVNVTNPGTTTSSAVTFTINSGGGAAPPVISGLTPASAIAGAAGLTLTVTGSNFVSGSVVQWNGVALTTTPGSATQLTASVPAALIQNAGASKITVANPGGAASGAYTFIIFPAGSGGVPPAITTLSPNAAPFGGTPFLLSVTGTGFVSGSIVQWNSSALTTTFLTSNLIAAAVPASLLQTVGKANILVSNPDGTSSNLLQFTVNPLPGPALNFILPDSAPAGKGALTLCATGAGFNPGAVVQWNGSPLQTTLLSDSLACATVPANLTAVSGNASVAVANPNSAPSTPVPFNIIGPPAMSPNGVVPLFSSVPVIQPGSWVSIYGSGLADKNYLWNGDFPNSLGGVSVTINGKPGYLWSVSPGQINLQAPDDTESGIVNVVVTNSLGSASSSVILAPYSPSFSLLGDGKHAAGVIVPPGGGTNDLLGPSGAFSFPTRPVKAGETLVLFGVGFGPTQQPVPAGKSFSGATPTTTPVTITIGGVAADVVFAGITQAGLYQFNLTVPAVPAGDQPLQASVNGVQTITGPVVSVQ